LINDLFINSQGISKEFGLFNNLSKFQTYLDYEQWIRITEIFGEIRNNIKGYPDILTLRRGLKLA
jgi:hypothetical protein